MPKINRRFYPNVDTLLLLIALLFHSAAMAALPLKPTSQKPQASKTAPSPKKITAPATINKTTATSPSQDEIFMELLIPADDKISPSSTLDESSPVSLEERPEDIKAAQDAAASSQSDIAQ